MTYIPPPSFFYTVQEPFHDCSYTSARTAQCIGPPTFNARRQLNITTTDALLQTDVSTNVEWIGENIIAGNWFHRNRCLKV